jgi:hypothetical protein
MKTGTRLTAVIALTLINNTAHASQYDCKISDGSKNDPRATIYSIDTDKEENKFVDLGNEAAVGCAVLRTQPQLISCGVGDNGNFSVFAVADDGTSTLGLSTDNHGTKVVLTCIKKK